MRWVVKSGLALVLAGVVVSVAAGQKRKAVLFPRDAAPSRCGAGCGRDRWPVKTLSDPDRDLVRFDTVIDVSIEALNVLPRPARRPYAGRVAPVELTLYRVEGVLAAWDFEEDRDIHLVIVDPTSRRRRVIAEIPDPGCSRVCSSGYAPYYLAARRALEAGLTGAPEAPRIRVTGVGFWDRDHGQVGAARNYLELHPVLLVEFR